MTPRVEEVNQPSPRGLRLRCAANSVDRLLVTAGAERDDVLEHGVLAGADAGAELAAGGEVGHADTPSDASADAGSSFVCLRLLHPSQHETRFDKWFRPPFDNGTT